MLDNPFWHDLLAEENYEQAKIISIAFDEAHTIVKYPEFRHKYRNIPVILNNMNPDIALHLLTATCPPKIYDDLTAVLGLQDADVVKVATVGDRSVLCCTIYYVLF